MERESLREEYLDIMERFESGKEADISDVLRIVFKYYFLNAREYFQTSIKRLGKIKNERDNQTPEHT
jgi:hypothetical protein